MRAETRWARDPRAETRWARDPRVETRWARDPELVTPSGCSESPWWVQFCETQFCETQFLRDAVLRDARVKTRWARDPRAETRRARDPELVTPSGCSESPRAGAVLMWCIHMVGMSSRALAASMPHVLLPCLLFLFLWTVSLWCIHRDDSLSVVYPQTSDVVYPQSESS